MILLLRGVFRLVRGLVLLVLLLVGMVAWLLFTEPGMRSLFGVAERVLPAGMLNVAEVSGSLRDELRLSGFRFASGELHVQFHHAQLRWQPADLRHRQFNITQIELRDADIHLPPPAPETEPPPSDPLTLPDIQLPIAVAINQLGLYQVRIHPYAAEQAITIDALELALQTDAKQGVQLDYLRLRTPEGRADIVGQVLPLGDYPLQLAMDWQLTALPYGPVEGTGQLTGQLAGLVTLEQQVQLHAGESSSRLDATAHIDIIQQTLSVQGQWQDLVWPPGGAVEYASPQGQFEFSGSIEDYRFLLEATAEGADIPSGTWQLQGQGSSEALERFEVYGQTLDGTLNAQGSARWQPEFSWQVGLSGSTLNPGAQWPELPGSLDVMLNTQGRWQDEQLTLTVDLQQLSGQLSGYPLDAQLQALLDGQNLTIDQLRLETGEARINASGHLDEHWDLAFQIDIPQLAQLLPDAGGMLRSQGQINGPRMQPQAVLDLALSDFLIAEQSVQQIQGQINLDSSGEHTSQIALQARGLLLGGQAWESVSLNGTGTPQAHNATLDLTGNLGRFGLGLQGGLDDEQRWQGQLTRLNLSDTLAGDWQLAQAVGVTAAANQARLAAPLCLASQPSRLCLDGHWDAATGSATEISLDQLDLARFSALLPDTVRINQTLSAQLQASVDASGQPQATAQVDLSAGQVNLEINGQPIEFDLGASRLSSRLDNDAASNELRIDLGDLGQITSTLQINDLFTQPQLDGQLLANLEQFALVSELLPQVQDVAGRLDADLRVAGSLPTPDLAGEISVREAGLNIPELGTRIDDIELTARGDDSGNLVFSGQARSGEGTIRLDGRYQLGDEALNLTLQGSDFVVLDTFSQVIISPDVTVVMDTEQVRVTGEVAVPVANLAPPPQQQARITASNDVVFVGTETPDTTPAGRGIHARLRLVLGDDVWVEAVGFRGQLRGDLLIEQTPELAPRGSGSLEVVSGDYTIYGQDLAIERGRLLFAAGPVDNPSLDLRISRQFDDGEVLVGAQVLGTLQQPRLDLFSTPPMANSNVVSYLLFGRPPGGGTGETQLLAQATAALGARGGNFLTRDIAETLGVDIRFDAASDPDDTAVTIGRYLAPGLYVSYGIGLFEAANIFNLRYTINSMLTLESTTSAENSSADLLFTLER
jgi:translocation and assembly module TamB